MKEIESAKVSKISSAPVRSVSPLPVYLSPATVIVNSKLIVIGYSQTFIVSLLIAQLNKTGFIELDS
jgi:hypothetical protein